ncbi:MAG: non-ribosomal peptide synthetase, partial [Aldersonia sp.]|nr:non-ribosomal peptide synthetase [Aldersonia sp.]
MNTQIETGREFWQGVLSTGGATAIPRWTLDPTPGIAEHVVPLAADLGAAMRRLAGRADLPLHSLLLAAHAKVLAVLSGEQDVVTGYATGPAGLALPCPLTVEPGSWRSLLQAVAPVEMDVVRHRAFDVDELKAELDIAGPRFETEFDPIDTLDTRDLADDVVLRIGLTNGGGALRLRYR